MIGAERLAVLERVALWAALGSLLAALAGLALTLVVVVRLPADAFVTLDGPAPRRRRTPRGLLLRLLRNAAGWLLILLGLVMAIPGVPGQGLLTILLGLLLADFPGRERILRRLLGSPRIRRGLDRLRARFKKSPFLWSVDSGTGGAPRS